MMSSLIPTVEAKNPGDQNSLHHYLFHPWEMFSYFSTCVDLNLANDVGSPILVRNYDD